MVTANELLQEMQGLYGPFTIAERVVQKIWMRKDFVTAGAKLLDGRRLGIRSTGTWNLLGGPDFREARLSFDGREVTGDVEVHFQPADWRAHGHAHDPAYARVILHVVMFPPAPVEPEAMTVRGETLPILVLLPLLHRSLEEYASDEALERITARDSAERLSELARMSPDSLRRMLVEKAEARWQQKVRFAELRINRLGWQEAAHHTALEILGYRQNRAAMLTMATCYPLEEWVRGLDVELVYREHEADWERQGVRPANHPRRRLQQYARWVANVPDWPQRLPDCFTTPGSPAVSAQAGSPETRKALKLSAFRVALQAVISGGALEGTRFDNLVCDGLLPLAAVRTGRDLFPVWFHWFLGDAPAEIRRSMGILGLSGPNAGPQNHGWAQGLLAWIIEREARASG